MMKFRLLVILASLQTISLTTSGQIVLPAFSSNATKIDSIDLQPLSVATKDYDFSISYYTNSYWSKRQKNGYDYAALCYKEGKRYQYYLKAKSIKGAPTSKKSAGKIIKVTVKQDLCDSVFAALVANKLFILDNDRLMDFTRQVNDTQQELSISDGRFYEFIIRARDKLRIVTSYEPEAYLVYNSVITERKYFIACRDAFLRLW